SNTCFCDQKLLTVLYFRGTGHIGRTKCILDGTPHDFASFDNIICCSCMICLCMPNDVINIWLECHLQISAGGKVSACRVEIKRMREQPNAGLLPDAKALFSQRLDDFKHGQHFCSIHCITCSRGAVEHHLG